MIRLPISGHENQLFSKCLGGTDTQNLVCLLIICIYILYSDGVLFLACVCVCMYVCVSMCVHVCVCVYVCVCVCVCMCM